MKLILEHNSDNNLISDKLNYKKKSGLLSVNPERQHNILYQSSLLTNSNAGSLL